MKTVRALGLDVGEKRIGLAVGDTSTALAVPVGAVTRDGSPSDLQGVLDQASLRDVGTLVVGMPLSLNGRMGPQAQVVAAFVEELNSRTCLSVVTWDERYTSVEADRLLREARGQGRGKRSRPPEGAQDAVAATVMLQAYLDSQRLHQHPSAGPR